MLLSGTEDGNFQSMHVNPTSLLSSFSPASILLSEG